MSNHDADMYIEVNQRSTLELYDRPCAPLELQEPDAESRSPRDSVCCTVASRIIGARATTGRCIGWRKHSRTIHSISYRERGHRGNITANKATLILVAGLVSRNRGSTWCWEKWLGRGEGEKGEGVRKKRKWGCLLNNLRAFGIHTDEWMIAAQGEDEWHKSLEQGAEFFMDEMNRGRESQPGLLSYGMQ